MNLDIANDFDGTVNMSDVTELQEIINQYNASIARIIASADNSFNSLTIIQTNISNIWENLNTLQQSGQQLVVNISTLEQKEEDTDGSVMDIQTMYTILRTNLSYLDTKANKLIYQLSTLSVTVINATSDLVSTTDKVLFVANDVQTKLRQVNASLILSVHLNQTVRSAFRSVLEANDRAKGLLVRIIICICMQKGSNPNLASFPGRFFSSVTLG